MILIVCTTMRLQDGDQSGIKTVTLTTTTTTTTMKIIVNMANSLTCTNYFSYSCYISCSPYQLSWRLFIIPNLLRPFFAFIWATSRALIQFWFFGPYHPKTLNSQTGCSFPRNFANFRRNVGILIGSLLGAICNRPLQLARKSCKFARVDSLADSSSNWKFRSAHCSVDLSTCRR